jgi:hypothetical protein
LFNSEDNENMYGAEGMSRSRFPINSFIIRYLEGGRGREGGITGNAGGRGYLFEAWTK